MTYEEFRKKYGDAIKEFDNVYNQDKLNIFKILRLDSYEIRHSNFLIWLLKKEQFRELFIRECCQISNSNLDIIDINREDFFLEVDENGNRILSDNKKKYFRTQGSEAFIYQERKDSDCYTKQSIVGFEKVDEICNPIQRYIDINIIGENYTLTIENKVKANEHDLQCVAYRNYMENKYKDKTNYFVFLAKKKPPFYNPDNPQSKYYKYIYVDYKQIKEILLKYETLVESKSIEQELINQYIEILNSWTTFPEEYKVICQTIDLKPFIEKKEYQKMMSIAMTDSEREFIEKAREYCEEEKAENDERVKIILEKILKDKNLIKSDYNKSRKKVAEDDVEKIQYAYALHVFSKKNNSKDSVVPGFEVGSDDDVLQSVDYSTSEGINIGIYSGLNTDRSRRLVDYMLGKPDSFIKDLHKLCESGWECKLKCSFLKKHHNTNHKSSNIIDEIEINMKDINEISKVLNQNDKSHIGDCNYKELIDYLSTFGKKDCSINVEEVKEKIEKYIGRKVSDRNRKSETKITKEDMKVVIHWMICCNYIVKNDIGKENMLVSDWQDEMCKELCKRTIQGLNIYTKGESRLGDVYAKECFATYMCD